MPLSSGTVTFTRLLADSEAGRPKDVRRWLSRGFQKRAFSPIERESDEDRAAGWVELEDPESVELKPAQLIHGEYALLRYRVDTLRVPKQVLNAKLDAWKRSHESEVGRPPKRAQIRETRDILHRRLKVRAFPAVRTYDVSWSLTSDVVQIWTTSRKIVDEIHVCLEEIFEISFQPLNVTTVADALGFDPSTLAPTAELVGATFLGDDSRVDA